MCHKSLLSGILFANFNQDYSCVSVGTRKGYSTKNCDPFGRVYTQNDGARGIVEMLFCTSLIALVGAPDTGPGSSPRKLQIVNTKPQSMICELLFPSSILAVKLNRKTLIIVLETEIYVYDISNMRLLHVIETVPNPEAYPAPLPSPAKTTSTSSSNSNANLDAGTGCGDVMLFSTRALAPANIVRAHRSPLAVMALSASGGLLATASGKGTVIRVFATPSLDKLYQFRHGTRETSIYSLAFNGAGTLLAAGSEHGTVHLWRVGKPPGDKDKGGSSSAPPSSYNGSNGNGSGDAHSPAESTDGHTRRGVRGLRRGPEWGTALRRRSAHLTDAFTRAAAAYLPIPAGLAEMWEPARDFAWAKLPPGMGANNNALGGVGERRCVVGLSR
ncbi:WD40 repeat-like protein [Mycena olivaceomarginata]|nr:WD40 repeat-like protein [Mycena olivaceomarginata]